MEKFVLEDEPLIRQYRVNTSWSSDDGVYIVEIPELPGCLSDGPTEAEARHDILLIAQEWLDTARLLGRPIPEPASEKAFA